MKADRTYDVMCSICSRHLSTDFGMGTFETATYAIKVAKQNGWTSDGARGNKCGVCNGTHHKIGDHMYRKAKGVQRGTD